MNEIKEDVAKWKDMLCTGTGRRNIDKVAVLPRLI